MNTSVRVISKDNKRYLYSGFGDVVDGGIDLSDERIILSKFVEAAVELLNSLPDGTSVLMLGGGTLSIPRHTKQTIRFTVIEVSPTIIEAAEHYFTWHPQPNVSIVIDDAAHIERAAFHDIVLIDIYYQAAPFVADPAYLQAVARICKRVIINAHGYSPPSIEHATTTMTSLSKEDWSLVDMKLLD